MGRQGMLTACTIYIEDSYSSILRVTVAEAASVETCDRLFSFMRPPNTLTYKNAAGKALRSSRARIGSAPVCFLKHR